MRNKFLGWSALAMLALAFACPVQAQRPIEWNFGVGYDMPTGTTADYLENGWLIAGGLTWHPVEDSPLSWKGELFYSNHDATHQLIQLGQVGVASNARVDDGFGRVWGINFNGIYSIPFNSGTRGYFTAGIGWQNREISLTQTVLYGGYWCDPWWGYCYPGLVPGSAIVASNSTTRFAENIGFGVEFGDVDAGKWYIELKYNRIETEKATEFIPLSVGYRF